MELRYYQREAIDAVAQHIFIDPGNPCIEIPTGGGKTPVIATMAGELKADGYRTMIVAHRKELLEQTRDKMKIWAPGVEWGILSAGLKKQEFDKEVIIAGIQSCYKYGRRISCFGAVDFLIIDECHLISTGDENPNGMYQTLIRDLKSCNPDLTVIGLTATPYRMTTGYVCGPDNILNKIAYSVSVRELMTKGYLSPLVSKVPNFNMDFNAIPVEHGEFKTAAVSEAYCASNLRGACEEMVTLTKHRHSVLVFCSSVKVAEEVLNILGSMGFGETSALVTGDTPEGKRDAVLRNFKREKADADLFGTASAPIKYLVNVDVLTTGFDASNVDAVVLFRPTMSPGLYYQMVGRGFRIDPSKENCLVLDYGGNILRHGPIDEIDPTPKKSKGTGEPRMKICPRCSEAVPSSSKSCPSCSYEWIESVLLCMNPNCGASNPLNARFCCQCGYEFPVRSKVDEHADQTHSILSTAQPEFEERVEETTCFLHRKKDDPDSPPMLWVQYKTGSGTKISEFVHFAKPLGSWGRRRAESWWAKRSSYKCPDTAEEALRLIRFGACAEPISVVYKPAGGKRRWPEIVDVTLGTIPNKFDLPEFLTPCTFCGGSEFIYCKLYDDDGGHHYSVRCQHCGLEKVSRTSEDFEFDSHFIEKYRIPVEEETPF